LYKKILIPVDLSEPAMSEKGEAAAVELAKIGKAEVRLINVQLPTPLTFMDYVPDDFEAQLRENSDNELKEIAARLDYPKELVSTVLRLGSIYAEVLAEAEAWGADLIVIGSHRPSMSTYLLGSNAKTIVRHAKCSVLVARG
jgi:nucleotide-binding universal stress UspA family protein